MVLVQWLNLHNENAESKKVLVRRSLSVRELNGAMIDFTNQDSVTRWTSQILAEIDSLPSSRFDLTGQPPDTTNSGPEPNNSTCSISNLKGVDSTTAVACNSVASKKPPLSPHPVCQSGSTTTDISIEMGSVTSTPSPTDEQRLSAVAPSHQKSQENSKNTCAWAGILDPEDGLLYGPAARKAQRRTLRSKLNSTANNNNQFERKAGSQARLNLHNENAESKKVLVRRSLSVRELNGAMIDFTNQDSVTRWTSQILAEIDSLPSSRFDLTGQPPDTTNSGPEPNNSTCSISNLKGVDSTTAIACNSVTSKKTSQKPPLSSPPVCQSGSTTTDISIEMGSVTSTPSPTDEQRLPAVASSHQKSQEDIGRSLAVAEVTANITLMARPSERRKQSVHAVVVNARKSTQSENSNNATSCDPRNCFTTAGTKGAIRSTSGTESSRLWRFLTRKKRTPLKKSPNFSRNLQQSEKPAIDFTSVQKRATEAGKIASGQPSNSSKPSSRAYTSFAIDRKLEVPHLLISAHEILSGDKDKRRHTDNGIITGDYKARSGTYICSPMKAIAVVKNRDITSSEHVVGSRRMRNVNDAPSPLTVWKRRTYHFLISSINGQKWLFAVNTRIDGQLQDGCSIFISINKPDLLGV
ncbi:unnamed protein product [Gongylonema pulchrum]|uniref:Rho GTPase-activating protein 7 n=1 Tax=Gongylonema pulchrum TaxID=637853 RepID=A0A183DRA4_9BILA|nr:unnamed protein product [Gongylonema pulchrum]